MAQDYVVTFHVDYDKVQAKNKMQQLIIEMQKNKIEFSPNINFAIAKAQISKDVSHLAEQITTEYNKIAKSLNLPEMTNNTGLRLASELYKEQVSQVKQLEAEQQKLNNLRDKVAGKATETINSGKISSDVANVTAQYQKLETVSRSLYADYNNLLSLQAELNKPGLSVQQKVSAYGEYEQTLKRVTNAIREQSKEQASQNANTNFVLSIDKAKSSLSALQRQWSAIKTDSNLTNQLKTLMDSLNNVKTPEQLKQWNAQFSIFKDNVKAAGKNVTSLGDSFKNNAAKFAQWLFAGNALMTVWRSFNQGVEFVKNLDSTLATINMTMPTTQDNLNQLGQSAIDMAEEMGTSADKVLKVAAIYANANASVEEILKNSQATVMLSNATGLDTTSASDTIQAAINQFDLLADSGEHVSDVLQKVSENIAVDFGRGTNEMAQAISISGQTAKDAGLSLEQYAAMVGKIVEQSRQSGSTVGNALKTIFTRIDMSKVMEGGEDAISNVDKAFRQVGIDVRKDANTFKSMDEILGELAAKWSTLTDVQKANITYQAAGVRQTLSSCTAMCNIMYI